MMVASLMSALTHGNYHTFGQYFYSVEAWENSSDWMKLSLNLITINHSNLKKKPVTCRSWYN